jgi:hypothetical protein
MTTRLLARFHRDTLAAQNARDVDLATETSDPAPTTSVRGNNLMADEATLRGMPVILHQKPRPLGYEARRKGLA